ncbi:hypothetical protein FVE85_5405 [Porphyridium purpureum]|uniref:Uncharacterized protein n=1 Tax=Porphyridium purpureum TaxID=35688 RepID=A0A5J4Z3F4_PORPP|nr:hypothetical protein FVE85_5405 [Porphyridium purpureum]|eukprot:POR6630..scf295_1
METSRASRTASSLVLPRYNARRCASCSGLLPWWLLMGAIVASLVVHVDGWQWPFPAPSEELAQLERDAGLCIDELANASRAAIKRHVFSDIEDVDDNVVRVLVVMPGKPASMRDRTLWEFVAALIERKGCTSAESRTQSTRHFRAMVAVSGADEEARECERLASEHGVAHAVQCVPGGAITLDTCLWHRDTRFRTLLQDDAADTRLKIEKEAVRSFEVLHDLLRSLADQDLLPHLALVDSKSIGSILALHQKLSPRQVIVSHASLLGGFREPMEGMFLPRYLPIHGHLREYPIGLMFAQPTFHVLAWLARQSLRRHLNSAFLKAKVGSVGAFGSVVVPPTPVVSSLSELYSNSTLLLNTVFGIEYCFPQTGLDNMIITGAWLPSSSRPPVIDPPSLRGDIIVWFHSELDMPEFMIRKVRRAVCSWRSTANDAPHVVTWLLSNSSLAASVSVFERSIEELLRDGSECDASNVRLQFEWLSHVEDLSARLEFCAPSVFISSCGLDAAHVALAQAIPLLCMPLESEQLDVAFRLYDAGVAEIARVEEGTESAEIISSLNVLRSVDADTMRDLAQLLTNADPVGTFLCAVDELLDEPDRSLRLPDHDAWGRSHLSVPAALQDRVCTRQLHGIHAGSPRWLLWWTLGCAGPLFFLFFAVQRSLRRLSHDAYTWLSRTRHNVLAWRDARVVRATSARERKTQ